MKLNKLVLAAGTVLLVAACGGSSSDDKKPAPTTAPAPTATSTALPTPGPAVSSFGGSALSTTNSSNINFETVSSGDLKKVVINGTPYALSGGTVKGLNGTYTGDTKKGVIYNNLTQSSFGYVLDNAGVAHGLAQGNLTAETDVPIIGKATYKGDSVFYSNSAKDASHGTFTAEVDFGTKDLDLDLDLPVPSSVVKNQDTEIDDITFSGNSFQGVSTHNNMAVKGNFFGPQASEIGGTYILSNWKGTGAFGGTRQ